MRRDAWTEDFAWFAGEGTLLRRSPYEAANAGFAADEMALVRTALENGPVFLLVSTPVVRLPEPPVLRGDSHFVHVEHVTPGRKTWVAEKLLRAASPDDIITSARDYILSELRYLKEWRQQASATLSPLLRKKTHCHSCAATLQPSTNELCTACSGLKCSCGKCLCGTPWSWGPLAKNAGA